MAKKFKVSNGVKVYEDDWHLYNEKPDPLFSLEHNKEVMKQTIEKTIQMRQKRAKLAFDGIAERADALGSYFRYLNTGDKTPEKYFGKRELARLRGRHILKTLFRAANGQQGVRLGWSDAPIDYLDYEY